MKPIEVEIWSDIACPWCYVGKRRFERALERFELGRDVVVAWRAFELDPDAPRAKDPGPTYAERLASKYRTSVAHAQTMVDTMTAAAAAEGLDFRFDLVSPGNTFDAHRLQHFAAERGRGDAAKERLLRAYMTEGVAIGDRGSLASLAGELGLDAAEAAAMLESDLFVREVRADEDEAQRRGIRGVPFFLVAGRYAVSGAQSPEVLLSAMERAAAETPLAGARVDAGGVCGPEGCA